MNGFWRVLEMEPTEDKKEVRRAYARVSKKYHPEEQPEAFRQVREAYEAALEFLRSGEAGENNDAALTQERWGEAEEWGNSEEQPEFSAPALLLEEEEDLAAQYADAPALLAFRAIYEHPRQRKAQKHWQAYFTSPEFLVVQREPGFTAALYDYLIDATEMYPYPPHKLILELCISYGIRHRRNENGFIQPFLLPLTAFEGIESILAILRLADPIENLDHEADKIRAACFKDYFKLQALAQSEAFGDPTKADEWQAILSGYQLRQLIDHPTSSRRPENEITERHTDGIRLLVHFLNTHELPSEVYRFLKKRLNLSVMEQGSLRQAYQPLCQLVSAKLAADRGPDPSEIAAALAALRRHTAQYRLPTPFPHTGLMPAYENEAQVTERERSDTQALLSLPEFLNCMLDPDFMRDELLDKICGHERSAVTVHFLKALIALYSPQRGKPGVDRLLEALFVILHRREHDGEFFYDRPYLYEHLDVETARFENREFWYYFLCAAFPAAVSPHDGQTLAACVRRRYSPSWEWQKRFVNYDEQTGELQSARREVAIGEQKVSMEFCLHHVQYFVDGTPVDGRTFDWETMPGLMGEDRFAFWLMLPLTRASQADYRSAVRELLSRLEELPLDRDTLPKIAELLANHLCMPLVSEPPLPPPLPRFVERVAVKGKTPLEKARALLECLGPDAYTEEDRERDNDPAQQQHRRPMAEVLALVEGCPNARENLIRAHFRHAYQAAFRYGNQPGDRFRLDFTLAMYPYTSPKTDQETTRLRVCFRVASGAEVVGEIGFGKDVCALICKGYRKPLTALRDVPLPGLAPAQIEGDRLVELIVKLLEPHEWEGIDWAERYLAAARTEDETAWTEQILPTVFPD